MSNYSTFFYNTYVKESLQSAEQIIPFINNVIQPSNVVDVGCGIGTWLSVFEKLNVKDILGIDGDYVDQDHLLINKKKFLSYDLTKPFNIDKKFDLAMSLEVGEHLPASCASIFVKTLVDLSSVILFSAAIPFQGGTYHINEQWPNYWAKLFKDNGYLTIDWLRPRIWDNERISYYYAQNSLIFVNEKSIDDYPFFKDYIVDYNDNTLSRIHPKKWLEANDKRKQLLRNIIPALPYAVKNSIGFRLNKLLSK